MSSRQNIHGQPFNNYVLVSPIFKFPALCSDLPPGIMRRVTPFSIKVLANIIFFQPVIYFPSRWPFGLVSHIYICMHWRIERRGSGVLEMRAPSPGPISFIFMLISVKILPNNRFLSQTQVFASLVLKILDPPLALHRENQWLLIVALMNTNSTLPTSFIQK